MRRGNTWIGAKFDYKLFSETVFEYLVDNQIGQNEFASKVRISKASMSRICNYKHGDLDTILRCCDFMGKSITEFLYV